MAGAAICGAMLLGAMLSEANAVPTLLEMSPFFLLYGFGFFLAKHFIYANLFNHVWNHTRLDSHRFHASMRIGGWLNLQFTNLLAIIATLGLAYPWAEIRSARYALSHLKFEPAGPIDRIERLGRDKGNALGETAAEFAGLDFGL